MGICVADALEKRLSNFSYWEAGDKYVSERSASKHPSCVHKSTNAFYQNKINVVGNREHVQASGSGGVCECRAMPCMLEETQHCLLF